MYISPELRDNLFSSGNPDNSVNGMSRRSQSLRLGRSDGDGGGGGGVVGNNNNNSRVLGSHETRLVIETTKEEDQK